MNKNGSRFPVFPLMLGILLISGQFGFINIVLMNDMKQIVPILDSIYKSLYINLKVHIFQVGLPAEGDAAIIEAENGCNGIYTIFNGDEKGQISRM